MWGYIKKAINSNLSQPLNNIIFDWTSKTPTFARLETSLSTLQTVVDVTNGSGVAIVWLHTVETSEKQARVVITVDGEVLSDVSDPLLAIRGSQGSRVYGSGMADAAPIENWGRYQDNSVGYQMPLPFIGFKKSFKFEVSTTSGSNIRAGAVVLA